MKLLLCFVLLLNVARAQGENVRKKTGAQPQLVPSTDEILKKKTIKKKPGLVDPLLKPGEGSSPSDKKETDEAKTRLLRSEDLRDSSFGTFLLGFQALTTWIPGKWTASYTQIFNRSWSLEGEYSRGSLSAPVLGVDIGEIREERASLQGRYYPGNSFNWSFGLVFMRGEANLGGDVPATTELNVFEMESFGAAFGFGNRWQWKNGLTFGLDWFRINQPLFGRWENESVLKTVSSKDADELKKIMRAFNTFPTFVLLGIHLGYTF